MAVDQGHAALTALAPIFASPLWRNRFERVVDLQACSATCAGLKSLSRDLDRKLAKFETCELGRLEHHLFGLRWQDYGAVRRDGGAQVREAGFSHYEHMDRLKIATEPPGCPVRNTPYGFVVTMPRGWLARQYDLRLNLALRPFRLTAFVESVEGRATCAAQGVPVERLVRYYDCGRDALQEADEILVIDPFQNGCRLATVMALVVLQAVAPELVPAEMRKLVPPVDAAASDPSLA